MARPALSAITSYSRDERAGAIRAAMPPSPTLTNPDMILPYDHTERETSTPSPPFETLHRHKEHTNQFSGKNTYNDQVNSYVGMAVSYEHTPAADYANEGEYSRGATTTAHQPSGIQHSSTDHQFAYTQQTLTNDLSNIRAALQDTSDTEDGDGEGENGYDSSSTISAGRRTPKRLSEVMESEPESLPTQVTNTDRANQNNDESPDSNENERVPMSAIAEIDEDGDIDLVSSMLGNEAERILENAKKRLTHMEGNLSRARTSFRMTPSPSPYSHRSSQSSQSGLIKPFGRGERRSQTSLAGALLRQRAQQGNTVSSHTRGLSDIYVPFFQSRNSFFDAKRQFRSFSALGSTNASGFGASDFSPVEEHFGPNSSNLDHAFSYDNITGNQSDLKPPSHRSSPSISSDHAKTPPITDIDTKSHTSNSPNDFANSSASPPRAGSQLKVRGLQDQMEDLRAKVSTLKDRTYAESMRRRSHQSLRTPSPFNAAEQYYKNAEDQPGRILQVRNTESLSDDYQPPQSHNNTSRAVTAQSDQHENHPSGAFLPERQEYEDKLAGYSVEPSNGDSTTSSSPDIDREALAEILREPEPLDDADDILDQQLLEEFPPVPPVTETMRHEDRVDAFDYEHFILHSALGNYSNCRTRPLSYASLISIGSTETARLPPDPSLSTPVSKQKPIPRPTSTDSNSTSATFATAAEESELYAANAIGEALDAYWEDDQDAVQHPTNGTIPSSPAVAPDTYHSLFVQFLDPYYGTSRISPSQLEDSPTFPKFIPQSPSSTPRASVDSNGSRNSTLSISNTLKASRNSPTTRSLVESIISSAAVSASTETGMYTPTCAVLNESDTASIEAVVQSLGNVSLELLRASTSDLPSSIDTRIVTILRRRLEAARKILDGDLDS
ncbi:hypothetical protein FQN57_005216 [Myotisia sp. PD_48]|nr:hypothetical protein FQN57_005216 [Myotisia sp. PD_48]